MRTRKPAQRRYWLRKGVAGTYDVSRGKRSVLVQVDWEFPRLASFFGWRPCHTCTDGTITCTECGKTAGEMIGEARAVLDDHIDEQFNDPYGTYDDLMGIE